MKVLRNRDVESEALLGFILNVQCFVGIEEASALIPPF